MKKALQQNKGIKPRTKTWGLGIGEFYGSVCHPGDGDRRSQESGSEHSCLGGPPHWYGADAPGRFPGEVSTGLRNLQTSEFKNKSVRSV